jgi:hypothetical protein
LLFTQFVHAQDPIDPIPLDDITERSVVKERQPLAYQPIREADILWEKTALARGGCARKKSTSHSLRLNLRCFKIIF